MLKIVDFYKNKFLNTTFWKNHYFLNYKGPYIHIISITRKCNNNCMYCASNSSPSTNENMSIKTAKKIIDFIFSIPLNYYHIEIQGGEPLLNFETLKFIVHYAKKNELKFKKKVHFSLTTNLLALDSEKLNFIIKNAITICSSFDPPFLVHHQNRSNSKKDYENIKKRIALFVHYSQKGLIEPPNLISTITKLSLSYYKEIIDEYVNLKVPRVQLGMIEPIGKARSVWKEISYTAKEYLDFYRNALSYIYYLNIKKNISVYEKGYFLLLSEILTLNRNPSRNLDILLRFAYDINGNIYSNDEFRMMGENGDKEMALGNVWQNKFRDIILSQKTREIISLILFPCTTKCYHCNYNIICNLAAHYNTNEDIFNLRCDIFKGIFSLIEKDINNTFIRKIFFKWLKLYG